MYWLWRGRKRPGRRFSIIKDRLIYSVHHNRRFKKNREVITAHPERCYDLFYYLGSDGVGLLEIV